MHLVSSSYRKTILEFLSEIFYVVYYLLVIALQVIAKNHDLVTLGGFTTLKGMKMSVCPIDSWNVRLAQRRVSLEDMHLHK